MRVHDIFDLDFINLEEQEEQLDRHILLEKTTLFLWSAINASDGGNVLLQYEWFEPETLNQAIQMFRQAGFMFYEESPKSFIMVDSSR